MWHKKAAKFSRKSGVLTPVISLFCAVLLPLTAFATVPTPRLKPEPPALSSYMSETDAQLFRKGLRSAKARRWSDIGKNIGKINDPVAKDTLRWIRAPEPVSGEGRAALARAYYAQGDQLNGDKFLRLAWRESRLTRDGQKKVFGLYKDKLTKDDHAARADHLIWSGYRHYDKARALLSLMGAKSKRFRYGSCHKSYTKKPIVRPRFPF